MYIPDLTERYPEGFRSFGEINSEGYEPSYEELIVTDSDYADELIELLQGNPVQAYELIRKYNAPKVQPSSNNELEEE